MKFTVIIELNNSTIVVTRVMFVFTYMEDHRLMTAVQKKRRKLNYAKGSKIIYHMAQVRIEPGTSCMLYWPA